MFSIVQLADHLCRLDRVLVQEHISAGARNTSTRVRPNSSDI